MVDPARAPRVSGLYAEGRIEGAAPSVLLLAESAIVRDGAQAAVWRVKDGRIAKVAVTLGERDERRGEYPVSGGLAGGDVILRNPGSALIEGQKVEFAKALPASAAATTASK
jgi:membrane fusion protein (multidrug efflux system)